MTKEFTYFVYSAGVFVVAYERPDGHVFYYARKRVTDSVRPFMDGEYWFANRGVRDSTFLIPINECDLPPEIQLLNCLEE